MKILHTADWHIGKSLYKYPLYEDLGLFFDELLLIINTEDVELLLIAGDIFDLANPSNKDKEMYYSFLTQLMQLGIQVIITAGNHDSVRMLEAPKELLKHLNIRIVGDGQNLKDQIIQIDKKGIKINVLAIPYLKDRDIRKSISGESYEDKISATRKGIINHYKSLVSQAKKTNTSNYIIGMGHLFVQGSSTSDSERDIQIGNLAGISVDDFGSEMDYLALGHIHRPQVLNKGGSVQYSGSPVALSFSERKDLKRVVLLDITLNELKIIHRPLKKQRHLIRISGSVDEIKNQLIQFKNDAPLKALIELQAQEKLRDESKLVELIELSNQSSDEYDIVNYKIHFDESIKDLSQVSESKEIEDLKPIDVFRSRMGDALDDKRKSDLESAFLELVEEWHQIRNGE